MIDEEFREKFNRYLINSTEFIKVKDTMTEDQLRAFVSKSIDDMSRMHNVEILDEERTQLVKALVSAVVSLGPLRPLMEDETITEIMVNGYNQIYIQRDGKIELTDIKFESNQTLMHTVQKILAGSETNKRIDESSPYVDFSLGDGSRVNAILPPVSMMGPVLTIRKFKGDINTVDDLLNLKEIDKNIATLLVAGMKAKLNVIFCGATGSGKTTALNVFSRHIPEDERIITIEDTPELRLLQKHVVTLVSKPPNIEGKGEITMKELFVNSLRMRPDRIIIGEVRGGEMLDLIQSISSGHSGSLGIVHAESPEDCFNRMINMMLLTGIRLSTPEIRKQVARAIDIIVHLELRSDGLRRVVYVTDVLYDEEKDKMSFRHIFQFKETGTDDKGETTGDWAMDKTAPSFIDKFSKRRIKMPDGFFNT